MRRAFPIVAALLLCGCQSYEIVQTNIFADEQGNVVRVNYGKSDRDHENTFRAPNGQEMPFKSKLAVEVTLPDGDDFTAWQCMNFLQAGTLYRSDNRKWLCQVHLFSCSVFRQEFRDGKEGYQEVFRGLICETPKSGYKPNPNWRKLKKDAKGEWK